MSDRRDATDLPEELLTQAAGWHGRIADGEASGLREEFERWRTETPAHAAAYAQVDAAFQLARNAAEDTRILALRQRTLAGIAARRRPPSRLPRAFAAGLAVFMIGSLGWLSQPFLADMAERFVPTSSEVPPSTRYHTAVGQQRRIELADGSQVMLNTASELRVAFSGSERRLMLDGGQALFTVAKDDKRPFIVESAGRRIVAHGTEFDVRIEGDRLRVALLEGSVSVEPGSGRSHAMVRLQPNEVLTARGDAVTVSRGEAQALASWRSGLLIFRDTDLRSAVEEMNRYSTTRIIIADETIAGLRISGAFPQGRSREFADAVQDMLPVRAIERSTDRIELTGP